MWSKMAHMYDIISIGDGVKLCTLCTLSSKPVEPQALANGPYIKEVSMVVDLTMTASQIDQMSTPLLKL